MRKSLNFVISKTSDKWTWATNATKMQQSKPRYVSNGKPTNPNTSRMRQMRMNNQRQTRRTRLALRSNVGQRIADVLRDPAIPIYITALALNSFASPFAKSLAIMSCPPLNMTFLSYQTSYSRQRGLKGVCQLRPVRLVTIVPWGRGGFTACSHTSNLSHSMTTTRILSPLYTMEERLRCTLVISYHRWLPANNLASS
jgi:hypothetical protein